MMTTRAHLIRQWASAILLAVVALGPVSGRLRAQTASAPGPTAQIAIRTLLQKAHSLEASGRLDLAVQTWQQVLLADPNNAEALANLARAARQAGDTKLAESYASRLRAVNPSASEPSEDAGLSAGQKALLQQAVRLTDEGKYAPAMTIYRQVFRMHPPPGDWSVAYYQTEAGTEGGRSAAAEGLRGLIQKYPNDPRYQIALGSILTYDPATREEGRKLLEKYPDDPKAAHAYRQSLLWDAANPQAAPAIRAYLATHQDAQLAAVVRAAQPQAATPPAGAAKTAAPSTAATSTQAPSASTAASSSGTESSAAPAAVLPPTAATSAASQPVPAPAAQAQQTMAQGSAPASAPAHVSQPERAPQTSSARSRAAEEVAAFQALNANRIPEAESRFKDLLSVDPNNPKALAGMGYVRMQQGNFLGAISYLEQAKRGDPQDKGLLAALDTARFWFIMGEGQNALNSNDLTTAEKRYREALDLRPDNPEALAGLGGTLLKAQQPAPAIPLFERAVQASPGLAEAWRGLFEAQLQQGNVADGLAVAKRIPPQVMAQLEKDPLFLEPLASAYAAAGKGSDAQATLEAALQQTFPPDARGLKPEIQMQLAGMLSAANRLDQAATIYRQLVAADPGNVAAWQGLVRVQHAMGHDDQAFQTLQQMPSAVSTTAMHDVSFVMTVASVYEAEKKPDVAQDVLQKAIAEQTSEGQKPSAALEMELASLDAQRGSPQLAYPIYQQVIRDNPDRADAWAGLLSALHVTGHDKEVVEQLKLAPASVKSQLEANPAYLQTMAEVYGALGRPQEATSFMGRVEQDYAAERTAPPATTEIENAWLLFNSQDDAGLYAQLLRLGARPDLTADQRRTIQTIWTNWAARRATQAAALGNPRRAIAILDAAVQAFPDNPAAIKALAIGYTEAGEPHQAVLIYKAQNMAHASSADYQSAVDAAFADGDNKDAEIWLRYGLAAYPNDPQILIQAARFEQARGDTAKAIKYYRASLKVMPVSPPTAKLAADLGLAAASAPMSLPSAEQPLALSLLLAPGNSDSGSPVVRPMQPVYSQPLPPYDGTSQLVPPYMSNPSAAGASTVAQQPANALGKAEIASTVRSAASHELNPSPAPDTPPQSSTPPQGASGEVYRPYVPYIAPASAPAASAAAAAAPTAPVAVQLGDSTPHPVRAQTDMTDVLPTERYAPSARANQAAASQAAMAAARADRIRRLQEESAARTGVSHPPSEDTIAATTENATYTPGSQGAPQVSQPATQPSRPLGNIPNTGAQQYPQPRTQPGTAGHPSVSRPRPGPAKTPNAPAAAPNPAPVAVAPSPVTPAPSVATTPAPAAVAPPAPAIPVPAPSAASVPAFPLAPPPTDAELRARNLPPLGGLFEAQAPLPLTPRQQAEHELASLESSYSGWLGADGSGRLRSGASGLDRLYDIEAPVEASGVIGRAVRVTAIATPVFLNSGVLTSSSYSASNLPYLGTLPANTAAPPAQQFSTGLGGELQLTTKQIGAAIGYTPYDFLLHNVTGRFLWSTLDNHLSIYGERQPVKDTQLSYAGLYDPGTASQGGSHPVWGAVVSTIGGARINIRNGGSSYSISGEGGILTGTHVQENYTFGGTATALFRVAHWTDYGTLVLGAALTGMHYQYDEVGLSYGQGGYFSPDSYFRASLPVSFAGEHGSRFHYLVAGALGFESFEQAEAPFYPLDPALQQSFVPSYGASCSGSQAASYNCGEYPVTDTTAFHYGVEGVASYRLADHWFGGLRLSADNSNNYNNVSASFFFRYIFRSLSGTQGYPTGLFRNDGLHGLRPLQIP